MVLAAEEFFHEEEVEHPVRYLPLGRVYSSSVPCVSPSGSSSVASKKVKTRMTGESAGGGEEVGWKDKPSDVGPVGMCNGDAAKPLLVYQRRAKRPRIESGSEQSGEGDDKGRLDAAAESLGDVRIVKARTCMKYELLRLGSGSGSLSGMSGLRLRSNEGRKRVNFSEVRKNVHGPQKDSSGWSKVKKWVELEIEGVDPHALIGLECKVLWPIDDDWYKGSITEYNSNTKQHRVKYVDDDVEHLILSNEKIKFHLSCVEMKDLCLKCGVPNLEKKGLNYNELLALALNFHDCQGLEPGELVWAKLTGHAMWPAVVVSESNFGPKKALKPSRTNESILVQFFGTHDFARIKLKQAIPFLNGLLSSLHLKCKQARFCRSLDEAKMYLIEQQLPKSMLHLQKCIEVDDIRAGSGEDEGENSDDDLSASYTISGGEHTRASPIEIGNLCVTSLGRIIYDSNYFHSKKHIWPEGYTSFRKFTSFKDPSLVMLYKMEILRNPKIKTRPSFRVTTEDGEQVVIEGWSKCLLSLEAHVFCRLEHMPFDVFFVEKTYY